MFARNTYSTENNSHVYFSPQLISCMFSSSIFSNVNIVHLVSLGIPFLCLSIYLPSSVCLSTYPSFCLFPSFFPSLCPYLPIALSLLSHSKTPCISANSTILHETIFTALNGSCSLSLSCLTAPSHLHKDISLSQFLLLTGARYAVYHLLYIMLR